MSELSPVELAVADVLGRRAYALGSALEDPELVARDTTRAARRLATAVLAGERDAAATVLELAWPDGEPSDAWWGTELGAACAIATAHSDRLDTDRAAAVLKISAAAIADVFDTGRLDRHPDGRATVASVRARLVTDFGGAR